MVATPNGERSLGQIQAELQAAGYNGPWTNADMISAYTRTAAPPAPTNQAPQVFGATPRVAGGQSADLSALATAFGQAGGLSQQQIANQKAEFDAQLAQQREQMERIGLPQLVIQQRLADLQQQQFQFQMRQVMAQQGLAERQLGLQALTAQAQLGGPSNWVQAYNLAQGLKNTDIPVFMNRLLTGQQGPAAVGGAGLAPAQSLQTLAAQAGAGGMAGGAPPSGFGGGPGTGALAPMPPLSGGGGGTGSGMYGAAPYTGGGIPPTYNTSGGTPGGVQNAFTLGGNVVGVPGSPSDMAERQANWGAPAPGNEVRTYAGGPNSPNDSAQGSLVPGTTGMYQNATQNFGYGPGQGSQSVSGTRGTNPVSYDPATGRLGFDWNFLTHKPRVHFGLWDKTAGQWASGDVEGAIDPTGGKGSTPGDWKTVPYVSGSGGTSYFGGVSHIDPTHEYQILTALPFEGGGVGNEPVIPGSHLLGLSNPQPAQSPGVAGNSPVGGDYSPPMLRAQRMGAYNQDPGLNSGFAPVGAGPTPTANTTGIGTGAMPGGPDMSGVYDIGRALFSAGGGALGPQALEGIGQTGQQMLQSVGQGVGADWNSFLNSYMRSRIGQGAAQAG